MKKAREYRTSAHDSEQADRIRFKHDNGAQV